MLTACMLSVVCGMATFPLLFGAGWRTVARGNARRMCWVVGGGLTAMFLTSRLFTYTSGWAWNHDSAVLCAVMAYLFQVRGLRSGRVVPFAAAGFLLAVATGIRLSFAFCFVPFAVSLVFGGALMSAPRRAGALAGAALASCRAFLPVWVFLLEAPRAFIFGNLEYPGLNTLFYQSLGGAGGQTLPGQTSPPRATVFT